MVKLQNRCKFAQLKSNVLELTCQGEWNVYTLHPFATKGIPSASLLWGTSLVNEMSNVICAAFAPCYEEVICSKFASPLASMLAIPAITRIPSVSPPTIYHHWLLLMRGIQG